MNPTAIHWFRDDLRLHDNPALWAARGKDRAVLPVYVLDETARGPHALGRAARWWLHHSLEALSRSLSLKGLPLILHRGDPATILAELARKTGATTITCARAHDPHGQALEQRLETALRQGADPSEIRLERHGGKLLFEPETIRTAAGGGFTVFTPFWRACLNAAPPAPCLPEPRVLRPSPALAECLRKSESLDHWGLRPSAPDWASGFAPLWHPGETGAVQRLNQFLESQGGAYAERRDRPDLDGTSRLSPHLGFGEISPRAIWHAAADAMHAYPAHAAGIQSFLRELGWREFSWHLLSCFPDLPETPLRPAFSRFPWLSDEEGLRAWQQGRTGYPLVDAGMRALWKTGWMHNRVRMICASFLVKTLLIPWQKGAAWFADTLVDADLANNSASWQWVAGCGADAAPYFRIFNPVLQGRKWDPDGAYIRRWVPELAAVPAKAIHDADAGAPVSPYPGPIVDQRAARQRALAAFASLKGMNQTR